MYICDVITGNNFMENKRKKQTVRHAITIIYTEKQILNDKIITMFAKCLSKKAISLCFIKFY